MYLHRRCWAIAAGALTIFAANRTPKRLLTQLSLSLFLLSSVPAFTQTAPPQALGYNLVFSDEFDSLNLSPTGTGSYTWYPGLWWQASLPLPSLITNSNSTLDLTWSASGGLNETNISTLSRDATQGHTFRYGYFEARMKWDVVTGSWPAFWMVPKQGAQGATDTGEIDIFEGQGTAPFRYYGTLHEWNGSTEIWHNSPNWVSLPTTNDFSQWHTYGLLWVPGKVTWYYDNQALFSSNTTSIFDAQDFFLVFSMAEGANWTKGNMTGVTATSLNLNVDWVRVWQSGTAATNPGNHGQRK